MAWWHTFIILASEMLKQYRGGRSPEWGCSVDLGTTITRTKVSDTWEIGQPFPYMNKGQNWQSLLSLAQVWVSMDKWTVWQKLALQLPGGPSLRRCLQSCRLASPFPFAAPNRHAEEAGRSGSSWGCIKAHTGHWMPAFLYMRLCVCPFYRVWHQRQMCWNEARDSEGNDVPVWHSEILSQTN